MITRKQEINPTPEELAQEFSAMGSEYQVKFFNALAECVGKWEAPFCMQLQWITDDPDLSDAGRGIMSQIGQYAYPIP